MLIEQIEITGFGCFREPVTLGPFSPGLNVLAQHNEWGKSTVLKALTRSLFDKYTCESTELKALRPKGSSLAPRLELIFSARGERWQLRKRFLDGKGSQLARASNGSWQRTDESDKADQRVRELLGAPKIEKGGGKIETWGLLRYLWAHQDEPAQWPDWAGIGGEEARRRLATVELDAQVGAVLARLEKSEAAILTERGRAKAKGPLERAEQELESLQAEHAALLTKRAETENLQLAYTRLQGELATLERERLHLREESDRLQSAAVAAEKLEAELRVLETASAQADDALRRVREDVTALEALQLQCAEIEAHMTRARTAASERTHLLPTLEQAVQKARADRAASEAEMERLRAILRLRAAADEASTLSSLLARVQEAEHAVARLVKERAALPALSAGQLKIWRELERTIRETTVQLEAVGLHVVVRPVNAAVIDAAGGETRRLAAGEAGVFKAPQTLSLNLAGWGTVEISSGASEVGALESQREQAAAKLAEGLRAHGLATLATAEDVARQAEALDQQIKSERVTLRALLGDQKDAAALEAAATRASAAVAQLRELAALHADESLPAVAQLRREEDALAARVRTAAVHSEATVEALEAARGRLEKERSARELAASEQATLDARLQGMREQRTLLAARHGGDPAGTLSRAQAEFIRAEARVAEARRALPEHVDKLPARTARATQAAAEADAEFARKTRLLQEHEILLRERGGEGLYSRIATLEERLELATAEHARWSEEAWGLRLAARLIQRRQQSAIRTVLRPLEDRLSAVLGDLTGARERRVFFDETLAIRGVGGSLDELVPFSDLSRGTREQLLLALRAAIALEVARGGEPTCLILDDVLVHTDALRQQNVLDYLQSLSSQFQIVILTCHADRYRGVGQLVPAQQLDRAGA